MCGLGKIIEYDSGRGCKVAESVYRELGSTQKLQIILCHVQLTHRVYTAFIAGIPSCGAKNFECEALVQFSTVSGVFFECISW